MVSSVSSKMCVIVIKQISILFMLSLIDNYQNDKWRDVGGVCNDQYNGEVGGDDYKIMYPNLIVKHNFMTSSGTLW